MSHSWPEQQKGEENPRARFSQQEAERLRQRHAHGVTIRQLAKETGASKSLVGQIVTGEKYQE